MSPTLALPEHQPWEDLKCLADRYLHNQDSRVETLRMGLSPSGSRFMVMILLEVDDII
jgi:hypothetical protein